MERTPGIPGGSKFCRFQNFTKIISIQELPLMDLQQKIIKRVGDVIIFNGDPKAVKEENLKKFRKEKIRKIRFEGWAPSEFDIRAFIFLGLERVKIPKSVITICSLCFRSCSSLKHVEFEQGSELKTIKDGAFLNTGCINIVFPKSLEYLGVRCFAKCEDLMFVELEANSRLKVIDRGCFADCKKLRYISFSDPAFRIQGDELACMTKKESNAYNTADHVYSSFSDIIPRELSECIFRLGELCIHKETVFIPEGRFIGSQWAYCVLFERNSALTEISSCLFSGSALKSIL